MISEEGGNSENRGYPRSVGTKIFEYSNEYSMGVASENASSLNRDTSAFSSRTHPQTTVTMAMARTVAATNLGSLHLPPRYTSHSLVRLPHRLLGASTWKISYGLSGNQAAKSPAAGSPRFKINAKM